MNVKSARDATAIQDCGACNPRGIGRALLAAIDDDAGSPAVRLILHQLVWVIGKRDLYSHEVFADYRADTLACVEAQRQADDRPVCPDCRTPLDEPGGCPRCNQ